ncbi:MAG: hypothetical protein SV862_04315, partial [Pseudomonadota bacterium]|nr:hypothetical protein [Pseudomonadota bacterium]
KQRRERIEALAQEISDRWDPIVGRFQAGPVTVTLSLKMIIASSHSSGMFRRHYWKPVVTHARIRMG